MSTFNTGNPVPSTDVRDLYDNAQNFDTAVNTRSAEMWLDRLGVSRLTWYGSEQQFDRFMAASSEAFQEFLLSSGYVDLGDYAAGIEITARNQIFWKDGELYRASASLVLPYTTTGVWADESDNFVSVGDAALRQELAAPAGSQLVGVQTPDGVPQTLQDWIFGRTQVITDLGEADAFGDWTAIFEKIGSDGLDVWLPRGSYPTAPFQMTGNGSFIRGAGAAATEILINAVSDAPSIWGLASNIGLSDLTIRVNPASIGEHDGLFSTGFTAGRYFYAFEYAPIRNVRLNRVRVVRDNEDHLVNSFTLIGNVADVEMNDCEAVGGLSGVVCHWGPDQVGTYGQPITGQTFHPNKIRINNFKASNAQGGHGVFISACYDVQVRGLTTENGPGSFAIVAGDVGNRYAPAAIKDKILTGISIDGVYSEVKAPDALLLDGEGNYEGLWQRVPMRGVTLDNVSIFASAGTTGAVAIARDVVGSVEIGSLVVRTGNFVTTGLELERSTGITVRSFSSNAANGYVVDRSKQIRVGVIGLKDPQATTGSSVTPGVSITGNRYASTLGANLSVGATTLTLATALAVRAYKGDVIRVSTIPEQFVVIADEYVPNTGTNIPVGIQPATFAATAGEAIYLDNLSDDVEIAGGVVHGYPKGLYSVTSATYQSKNVKLRNVIFDSCQLSDIEVERVDALDVLDCEFRNGGTRSTDGVTVTQALKMTNCRDFRIVNSRIGKESRFYTHGLFYADSNNNLGLVADCMFGEDVGIGGQDVNSSLKGEGKDNVYRNNRYVIGGDVVPVLT